MKILIAAGGTGGHIYPGIAIAEELKNRDPDNQIVFIGSSESMEKKIVRREGFEIKLIHARGVLRKISFKAISAPFITLIGFFQSIFKIRKYGPDWVVATGGYVSFPVIFAAKICRIPILLHEQNVLPGITSRFCSGFAKIITLSFEQSTKYLKGVVTGNPVRKRILTKSRIKHSRFTILVLGGSQGSRRINWEIVKNLPKFKNYQIIHICGERDFPLLPKQNLPFYSLVPYMYNIEEGLRIADLVISRAGATVISEILAAGIPSILIPFPYSAEGHQKLNAKVLEEAGAAKVLDEKEIGKLPELLLQLANDRSCLHEMQKAALELACPDAAEKIVDLLYAKT